MKFRNDIGALRALAVLAVLFFHFKIPYFDGGFSGVDIFFVISGYLMTHIILKGFEDHIFSFRQLQEWEEAWKNLFVTLKNLQFEDLGKTIYIRNQGHTVVEAINRQLSHYPYHVGQIVMLGKMMKGNDWRSLSIPRGESDVYNSVRFIQSKRTEHFTDEILRHLDG